MGPNVHQLMTDLTIGVNFLQNLVGSMTTFSLSFPSLLFPSLLLPYLGGITLEFFWILQMLVGEF